jgi:DNA-binding CsgD family transcriptional regulator
MLRGDLAGADERWATLHTLPPAPLAWRASMFVQEAEFLLWAGRPQETVGKCRELLNEAIQATGGDVSHDPLLPLLAPLLNLAVRGCADLAEQGRATRDAQLLAAAREQADALTAIRGCFTPEPFAAGTRGGIAEAAAPLWEAEWSRVRDDSSGEVFWPQAAVAWDRLRQPHRAAYAHFRHAEAALRRRGPKNAAGESLRLAAMRAKEHQPLTRAIHNLGRHAGIRVTDVAEASGPDEQAAPGGAAAVHGFGLTARELAVLRLLAEGNTNAEIGAALYMSPKTASVHVTHILRKLDVTSRTRAATIAERAGLLSGEPLNKMPN